MSTQLVQSISLDDRPRFDILLRFCIPFCFESLSASSAATSMHHRHDDVLKGLRHSNECMNLEQFIFIRIPKMLLSATIDLHPAHCASQSFQSSLQSRLAC